MSVGLGLVISTALIIAAWQVERRGAWRKLAKGGAGVLALFLCLLLILGAFALQEEYQRRTQIADSVARLLAGEVDTFNGIRLRMTEAELKYAKGVPDPVPDASAKFWIYRDSSGSSVRVGWDEARRVHSIACFGKYSLDCPDLGGISIAASESAIRSALGEPFKPAVITEKGYLKFLYGRAPNRAMFLLKQDAVSIIYLTVADAVSDKPAAE